MKVPSHLKISFRSLRFPGYFISFKTSWCHVPFLFLLRTRTVLVHILLKGSYKSMKTFHRTCITVSSLAIKSFNKTTPVLWAILLTTIRMLLVHLLMISLAFLVYWIVHLLVFLCKFPQLSVLTVCSPRVFYVCPLWLVCTVVYLSVRHMLSKSLSCLKC